ncbi:MAG: Serine acetyltransferase [Novosphingobium sp.]|nr:Serine acetyltransferase [Novosphingobium sp.]
MFARLTAYLDSIVARDPAPRSRWEVLLYPGLWAVFWHRVAHWLFEADMFFLARFVNHTSRFLTGFEIHPGAQIGKHLFLEHGFITIGETAVIGDNVTIYPCVTLGGTNPTNGKGGKRHPTLENNVIVGAGAQILGPITVGHRARIGANAVVTEDVPEGATMVGVKARSTLVIAETWQKDFMPYGTPCKEPCAEDPGDPRLQRFTELEVEVAALRAELQELLGERRAAKPTVSAAPRKSTRS